MKRWEKAIQEYKERIDEFVRTGSCTLLGCVNCPLRNVRCVDIDDEIDCDLRIKLLNEEVE